MEPFLRLLGTSNMVSSRLKEEVEILVKRRKWALTFWAADAALYTRDSDSSTLPFRGFVEVLIGVNLLQTEVLLFHPKRKMGLE